MNAQAKGNGFKLIRLIVEQGTEALRNALEDIHPPARLQGVLIANKKSLLKLNPRLINDVQWNLLFPPSGNPPDLKSFDVTLLTVLLRHISCYLLRPATEWDTMPPDTDRSIQANVVRIKLLKNEVYTYIDSTEIDEAQFEDLWQQISQALVDLKIPQADIDIMKTCNVSSRDKNNIEILKKWFLIEKIHKDKPAKHSSRITRRLKKRRKGSCSSRKTNAFFDDFVCDYLAKHIEARHLVTLKEEGLILRFNNVDNISSIYWDFKKKDSRKLKLHLEKKKKCLQNIMAQFEKKGLLKKVGAGKRCGEKYLKYEVKNSKIWSSLSKKYSVQRNSRISAPPRKLHQKHENFSEESDSGISNKPTEDTADSLRKGNSNGHLENFVCVVLTEHAEAHNLITLKENSQCTVLRFNDIDRISLIYCDLKDETGTISRRKLKKKKTKFKNLIAPLEEKGLLQPFGGGMEYGKKYLEYQVKDSKLWDSLAMNYTVQRRPGSVHERSFESINMELPSEASSDIREMFHDDHGDNAAFNRANPSISENETSQLPPHLSTASARDTQWHSLSSKVINENGENVGDIRIHVLQDSSSSFEGLGSHDARHSLSSQVINENGDASQHASEISSIEEKEEEDIADDSTEEDEDTFLEEKFLDDEYCIREEVHEKFKRFPWLHGAYGITGPNEKFPRSHFYVTVEKGKKKSEILDDIKAAFDCEPSDYFELLPEPKKPVKFKFLLKPTPGGGIAVKEDGPNPLQASNDIDDEESSRASGTLTMFCCKDDKHYALTCFHVGVITDKQRFDRAFNQQDVLDIRKSRSIAWHKEYAKKTLTYCYRKNEIDNTDENENTDNSAKRSDLGTFSKGSFDEVSDIMSIEVAQNIKVDCTVAEIDSPVWARIWQELNRRVIRKRGIVPVRVQKLGYSSNLTDGYIDNINFSYNHEGELLFRDAIAVKSDSRNFLHAGDSGALICYLDSKNKKQAFAYGVCEIDKNDSDEEVVVFREENGPPSNETNKSLFICLRLNTAMRKLELSRETGCFNECGSSQEE